MTSSTKQRDPEDIRVRLSFDVDQITQSLVYEFYSITKKKPMRIKKYGRVAGSYNFVENDKLYIEIEAYNTTPKTPVRNLNLNCTFVFTGMPNSAGSDQALSPFDKDIASFTFADGEWDNRGSLPIETDDGTAVHIRKLNFKPVTVKNGLWAVSGFLSVTYTLGGGTEIISRVFSFDPETSAGDGGPGN